MTCGTCGTENRRGASFCRGCGAALSAARACPRCGFSTEPDQRFCDSCGATLPLEAGAGATPRAYTPPHLAEKILRARGSIEGERRTVSILFADAVGSTALAERIDPEKMYRLIQGSTARMLEAVHSYEGHVAQFTGDGIMAMFGAPIAHEDSARRAVAAGLDMQRALEQYAKEAKRTLSIACRFRVGVHSGPVVVGSISDDLAMDFTALGDTANLAARMEQSAEPGSVLLSGATHRAVADFFECEPVGSLIVKGRSEPVPAYRAVREKPARTRFEIAAERGLTPFVGRAQERRVLGGYFEQAARGQGQVVAVTGEAGIGKSRLLLEFRRSLRTGVRWLEGHCISYGRTIPYLPIADVVRAAFGVEETDSGADIVRRIEETTASWEAPARAGAPYLRFLLAIDPGEEDVSALDPRERRARIFDAVRTLVVQEGTRGPLVLVIEDLHWIDEKSDEAVGALIDLVSSTAVLLVLTYRPGYTPSFGERSFFSRIALRPLPARESARMAAAVLRVAAMPAEVERVIAAKAEGNPFFVEEITKSLVESGALARGNGSFVLRRPIEELHIPNTIQEVILSRIDRLQHEAKESLQLASVIGREFTVRLLKRISDLPTELDDVLAHLKTLELIYEKTFFPELAYMFKHALTHDVAYSTLLLEQRRALHRIVGAALEELYADRIAEHYEALAHHYFEGEDWPKALDYLLKAGDKAAAAFASREAVGFYRRGIEIADRLGDPAALLAFARKRYFVDFAIADVTSAREDAERAVGAARRLGDRSLEGLGLAMRGWAELYDHDFETAEETVRDAMAIGREGHPPALLFGAVTLWAHHIVLGRPGEAEKLHPLFAELGPQIPDPFLQTMALGAPALPPHWKGRFDQAVELIVRARPVFEQTRDITQQLNLRWMEALARGGRGEYQEALRLLQEVVYVGLRCEEGLYTGRAINTVGWVYGEIENHERAMEWNRKGIDAAALIKAKSKLEVESNARLNLGDNLMALGRLDEAEEQYRIVEQVARNPKPEDRWTLMRYSQHLFHSCGELWLRRGDPERALSYADECLAIAEDQDARKNIVKGRRLRGQALGALGKMEDAEADLARALEVAREVGNPPQLWKTLVAVGDLRRAQDREREAGSAYEEAAEVIERVARGIDDRDLSDGFLASAEVAAVRDRASRR